MRKIILLILVLTCTVFSGSAKIALSEDFNKFTAGSEAAPSDEITDFDAITQTPGWSGIMVRQAGGCAYIPAGAQLSTPALDLGASAGNYCIAFKARSATPGAFFFLMDSNGGYMSGYITDRWETYTVALSTGSGPSIKAEPTVIYFYGYTDFFIDDVIIDDSGVATPAALPATDFTADSFTANWQTALNAETYMLNVFTLDYDVATTVFSRKYIVKNQEVDGTSFTVNRPDFDTPYYYTVSGKSGDAVSGESNIITVRPEAVDPVSVLSPSDVSPESFTANWTASSLATQYYLHILKHHQALHDETYAIIDTDFSEIESSGTIDAPQKELEWLFDGDWFANMPVLADGIIGINNQDIDFFGQAYLQSPVIDLSACGGEVKISFSAFSRKGFANASVRLYDHAPSLSLVESKDFTVSDAPQDYEFTLSGGSKASSLLITSEDSGMMFIDDLKVNVELPANSSIVLPVRTLTTAQTSATVDISQLPADDRVAYYVRASWAVSHKDGEVRQIPEVISDPSDYVWVYQNASVDDISADGLRCSVRAEGSVICIINPDRLPVDIFTPSGNSVASYLAPSESVQLSVSPGLYIVRVGTRSYKLSVPHF